jgi:hypothetical protein
MARACSSNSRERWLWRAAAVLIVACCPFSAPCAQTIPEVPSVNAELGPCWADFHVTDAAGKPVYNAKVHVLVRYGFMSKRKTELEVGTNSDGNARIAGLPQQVKKPLTFDVRFGDKRQTRTGDPAANCHANFPVELK